MDRKMRYTLNYIRGYLKARAQGFVYKIAGKPKAFKYFTDKVKSSMSELDKVYLDYNGYYRQQDFCNSLCDFTYHVINRIYKWNSKKFYIPKRSKLVINELDDLDLKEEYLYFLENKYNR